VGIEGGGTRCVLDGIEMDCSFIKGEISVQCPNNDCGVHSTTVTARTSDGQIVGSSTFLRSPGQPGWDGSLDGTYRVNPTFGSDFDFNNPIDARAFLDEPELPYMRISGGVGPQNSWMNNDPDSIDNRTNSCSIKVTFVGQGLKGPNGPGNYGGYNAGPGLGFTVSGSVNSGQIGFVDEPNGRGGADHVSVNPNGSWTIQQYGS